MLDDGFACIPLLFIFINFAVESNMKVCMTNLIFYRIHWPIGMNVQFCIVTQGLYSTKDVIQFYGRKQLKLKISKAFLVNTQLKSTRKVVLPLPFAIFTGNGKCAVPCSKISRNCFEFDKQSVDGPLMMLFEYSYHVKPHFG